MKKLLFLAACVAGAWYCFHESPAKWRGMPAPKDPVQSSTNLPAAFSQDGRTITPLARYHLTAVVLGRERYRNDRGAAVAPVDLALGWGPMSVASAINDLSISQSGRWYEYQWSNEPPLDPGVIATHSANTHCLPANPATRQKLLAVRRHELVTLDGYLVELTEPGGYRWRSSLSRDDTRGGSCEVFWITEVTSKSL